MRVAILDDFEGAAARSPAVARLAARVEVSVLQDRLTSDEALAARLGETEVILLIRERTRFGAAQLARLPRLELIAQTGGGVAHIDLNAATARGILITVTGSNSTPAMVELTFGLMVAVLRRIPALDRAMRRGEWPGVPGRQLHGKILGIVGLGKIGREVARAAHAFGLRVLACGQTLTDERARAVAAVKVSLRELLEQADIVSIHAKLTEQTRGLLGDAELALMKPGAVLINTARGPIVEEHALLRALEQGRIAAGLDVYEQEPLPRDHPLTRLENVALLPHRGYVTEEVLAEFYAQAVENILNYLDGRPTNLLNPDALSNRARQPV